MTEFREQLLSRMTKIYGLEHEIVIDFATICEGDDFTDKVLEVIVKAHEENPVIFNN